MRRTGKVGEHVSRCESREMRDVRVDRGRMFDAILESCWTAAVAGRGKRSGGQARHSIFEVVRALVAVSISEKNCAELRMGRGKVKVVVAAVDVGVRRRRRAAG